MILYFFKGILCYEKMYNNNFTEFMDTVRVSKIFHHCCFETRSEPKVLLATLTLKTHIHTHINVNTNYKPKHTLYI